jgi:hypothetical protein
MEVLNDAKDLAKSKANELISNASSKIDSIPLVSDAKDAFNNEIGRASCRERV